MRAIGCLLVFAVHCAAILFPALLPAPAERAGSDYLPHAVVGFLILSGLVLSLPFVGEAPRPFRAGRFYYSRFLRLYPLYWLSLLFALGLRFAVTRWAGLPSITPWPGQFWSVALTPRILFEHFAGFLNPGKAINPAYWTLANEIQACILLPLVVVLVRRTQHWAFSVVAMVAMIIAPHYLPEFDVVSTLGYFVMGTYSPSTAQDLATESAANHAVDFRRSALWSFLDCTEFRITLPALVPALQYSIGAADGCGASLPAACILGPAAADTKIGRPELLLLSDPSSDSCGLRICSGAAPSRAGSDRTRWPQSQHHDCLGPVAIRRDANPLAGKTFEDRERRTKREWAPRWRGRRLVK